MAQQQPATSKPVVEGPQPTVRVMRLYKPIMHVNQTMPRLSNEITEIPNTTNPDFMISQYLLLPDNFGDIYLGELFAAYVSVVNGVQDITYQNVTLSVRLQTINAFHDLYDSRAVDGMPSGTVKLLAPNQTLDMVVQQSLSELGTHTLRVTVVYTDSKSGEVNKTLRKFYRFNVLNPISIVLACLELYDRYMVQCQIVNSTKITLYLEEVKLVPSLSILDVQIIGNESFPSTTPSHPSSSHVFGLDMQALPLLTADESFAYAFVVHKPKSETGGGTGAGYTGQNQSQSLRTVGCVEVKWCSTMGEHGMFRSDSIAVGGNMSSPWAGFQTSTSAAVAAATVTPASSPVGGGSLGSRSIESPMAARTQYRDNAITIFGHTCPSEAVVGETFEVVLRVTNTFSHPIVAQLQSKAVDGGARGLLVVGLSFANIGTLSSGESRDVSVAILPVNGGMHDFSCIVVVDLSTKVEYAVDSILKVMVYDNIHSSN